MDRSEFVSRLKKAAERKRQRIEALRTMVGKCQYAQRFMEGCCHEWRYRCDHPEHAGEVYDEDECNESCARFCADLPQVSV